MIIRNVRPWGKAPSDVTIVDGYIADIRPHQQAEISPPPGTILDGEGRILLPSFTDSHVHLDSTRIGQPFKPHTAAPGVWNMIMNDRKNWRQENESAETRAASTLGRMIARGATRVRSFAQIDADCGLERYEAVAFAKKFHQSRADVAIVAFPQAGLLLEDGVPSLMEEALRNGADEIGGIDPCGLDKDPVRHLDVLFGLAEKYQVPVDIHLHEPGDLGLFSIQLILERTRALDMKGKVSLSHAFALTGSPTEQTLKVISELAELDVAITTVAPAGRPSLPLEALTAAGIRVGLGQDGQRDYWSPYGNCDMLDRTWQLAFTNGFRKDSLIEHCVAIATIGGASVIDPKGYRLADALDRPGLSLGDPAELVLVAGETVAAAVMDRFADRTVIHQGQVIAAQGRLLEASETA
ncbi:amidohydrolase [Arthrobacter sp. MI7-26]|uniref:amidohydrolase n=1 Tax=Arthrobacter sp. MI7-26 TaxID=2993653 RepID=UPI002249864E|nr:amidohydrolase [Arthrobacter sp. MI7-26]MCX2750401.1 amidohydrolase [Arthrobacter sp. MI7-26]